MHAAKAYSDPSTADPPPHVNFVANMPGVGGHGMSSGLSGLHSGSFKDQHWASCYRCPFPVYKMRALDSVTPTFFFNPPKV